MLKLYDYYELEAGIEVIKPQLDDPAMSKIESILTDIENGYSTRSVGKSLDITKNLFDLEEVLSKRFGFKVSIDVTKPGKDCVTSSASCRIIGFDNGGGLYDVSRAIDLLKNTPEDKLKKCDKDLLESIGIIDKWVKLNGIYIDEDKAYIANLPKDFKVCLTFNFDNLFNKTKVFTDGSTSLSIKEITAIVLHEVGHAYTFLSYAYRTRMSKVVFEDVIRDQQKKGKEPKQQIVLAYKEAFDKNLNLKEFDKLNTFRTAMLCMKKLSDRYRRSRYWFDRSTRSSTDCEFAADQFVTRFGYGEYLGSAVRKIGFQFDPIILGSIMDIDIYILISFTINLCLICGAPATLALLGLGGTWISFCVLVIVCVTMYWVLSTVIGDLTKSLDGASGRSYDITTRRIERIGNEITRQLRLFSDVMTDKDIKNLIGQVERVDSMVEKLKDLGHDYKNIPGNKFLEFFSSNFTNVKELEELDVIMENLMENRLHVFSKKF